MKHTPGPWIRDDDQIGTEIVIGRDKVFLPVCTLEEPGLYRSEDVLTQIEANAELIMSAPKLLAENISLKKQLTLLRSRKKC